MKNAVILYAHPNPKSFSNAIKETAFDFLSKNGFNVEVVDLYSINFNPILSAKDFENIQQGTISEDVKKQQEIINKSDLIVLVFPVWWYNMPAILKGYIDRVFSYGFAYVEEGDEIKGLLKGKKVVIFANFGGSEEEYKRDNFDKCLSKTFEEIFRFCGIDFVKTKFFYSVPYVDDSVRKGYLAEVENTLKEMVD